MGGQLTVLRESGLGVQFWFSTTMHEVNCRNATYMDSLSTTQYEKLYGKEKDVSRFRPFRCRGYQNKERWVKGRGAQRALEVPNLGLAAGCITSGYKLLIKEKGKILMLSQQGLM